MGLSSSDAQSREIQFFRPYHNRIAGSLEQLEPSSIPAFVVSIHSFTPYLNEERPWHIGVLWDRDQRLADPLLAALSHQTELLVGANQPYSGHSPLGYSCQTHGDAKGRPNVILEIRQDLIDSPGGVKSMTAMLGPIIADLIANNRPLARLPPKLR
jgi:predicted N-formylglutamate amidohydrolase